MAESPPLVLFTPSWSENPSDSRGAYGRWRHGLNSTYSAMASRAGGSPVALLPCGRRHMRELIPLSRLVVLTGGGDPDPALYGMGEEGCGRIERHRSRWDLEVYRAARESGAAILGICMGMQIAAVAEGVPLVRDIPLETGSPLDHAGTPGRPVSHPVALTPGTFLGDVLGDRAEVSSFHHQAVGAVPEGFREAARAPDGVLEAIESADGRVVCVQWHPERDRTGDVLMKAMLWS